MLGIIAVILLALAFLVHGFHFHPNAWIDWTSLALLGLTFLALYQLGVGPSMAVITRRTAAPAPPQ